MYENECLNVLAAFSVQCDLRGGGGGGGISGTDAKSRLRKGVCALRGYFGPL